MIYIPLIIQSKNVKNYKPIRPYLWRFWLNCCLKLHLLSFLVELLIYISSKYSLLDCVPKGASQIYTCLQPNNQSLLHSKNTLLCHQQCKEVASLKYVKEDPKQCKGACRETKNGQGEFTETIINYSCIMAWGYHRLGLSSNHAHVDSLLFRQHIQKTDFRSRQRRSGWSDCWQTTTTTQCHNPTLYKITAFYIFPFVFGNLFF